MGTPAFPADVILIIRNLTSDSLEACVSSVRSHMPVILKVPDHLKLLIVEIATKAVFCPELAATAAHLCGRLDQNGETKGFRAALLSQCESTFNTLGANAQSWSLPAAIGLGSFIGALHAEGLLRGKIVHSCMTRSLFGANVSKDHVPNAPSLVFLSTLYVSVEQARGFSDQRHRGLYRKQMEELRKSASVDESCRERLTAALAVGERPAGGAKAAPAPAAAAPAASPTTTGYRHDPYATVDLDTSFNSPTTPSAAASPTGGQAPFPQPQQATQPPPPPPQQQQQQFQPQAQAAPQQVQNAPAQMTHLVTQQSQSPQQQQQQQQQQPQQQFAQAAPQRQGSLTADMQGFVQPQQPQQPVSSAAAYPPAAQLPAAQVPASVQAEATARLSMSQYAAPQQALTQDTLSQWVVQSAPLCGAKRTVQKPAVAPPQAQPMDLAQLYQEAAVYKSRDAAAAAIKRHNVVAPRQPFQPLGQPSYAQYQQAPQQQPQPQPQQQQLPQSQYMQQMQQQFPQQQQQQQQQPPPPPQQQQQQFYQQPQQQQQHQFPQQAQAVPQQPLQPVAPPPPPPQQQQHPGIAMSPTTQQPCFPPPPSPPAQVPPEAPPSPPHDSPKKGEDATARRAKEEVPETDIFAACTSKQEARRLGNLIINRALQEGYNRSYGAARRKLARFCRTQCIGDNDQGKLIGYLNDLYLAGQQYRGLCLKEFVDAPTRLQDELQSKRPAPGGMRAARRCRTYDDDDEVDSVYSCGTAGTDTWGDQISDDELDELSNWGDLDESNRLTDYVSSHGRASSMADSVMSEPADPTDLTTPVQSPLDLEEMRQCGAASVSSRRSSRSALSRSSSKSGLCYSKLPEDITIDDRVKVVRADGSDQPGTVKYIGFPRFADKGDTYDGCWVGVCLDEPVGNHDGTIEDERFFVAKPQHGVFVRENKIVRQGDKVEGPVFFYPQHLTKRMLRFDTRAEALRPYGFQSGDVITATHTKYKNQGKRGIVIGVRHGLLYWRVESEEITGACACKNTVDEILEVFKRKKYRKVGTEVLHNHLADLAEAAQGQVPSQTEGISKGALAKVAHLVDPDKVQWEGQLVSPTPAQGYQKWFKSLWRKKKIDAVGQS